jgi:hypothetical protein
MCLCSKSEPTQFLCENHGKSMKIHQDLLRLSKAWRDVPFFNLFQPALNFACQGADKLRMFYVRFLEFVYIDDRESTWINQQSHWNIATKSGIFIPSSGFFWVGVGWTPKWRIWTGHLVKNDPIYRVQLMNNAVNPEMTSLYIYVCVCIYSFIYLFIDWFMYLFIRFRFR